MPEYNVTLYYRYKDVQKVEAESKEDAIKIAEANADEKYDSYVDGDAVEIEGD